MSNHVLCVTKDPETDKYMFPSEVSDAMSAWPLFAIDTTSPGPYIFNAMVGRQEVQAVATDLGDFLSVQLPGVGEFCFEKDSKVPYEGTVPDLQNKKITLIWADPKELETAMMEKGAYFYGSAEEVFTPKMETPTPGI